MGSELILSLAALLLALYCLVFSVRRRRALYYPLPKGTALLRSGRAHFLPALCLLALSSALSAAESAAGLRAADGAPGFLHTAWLVCHGVFLPVFAVYALPAAFAAE